MATDLVADGAWPYWTHGIRVGDHTYIPHANNSGGVEVSIYDHATEAVTTVDIEADGFWPADQHNAPAILVRQDGKLLTVYCGHGSNEMYRRVSVATLAADPTLSGGFTARATIDPQLGADDYTYPQLFMTASGPLLFYRHFDGQNNWEVSRSTDDGDTWSLFTNLTYGVRCYATAFLAPGDILHVVSCDGSYAEDEASLYHFYWDLDADTYHKTDGTAISGPLVAFGDMTPIFTGGTGSGVRGPTDLRMVGSTLQVAWTVQTGTPSGHIGEDMDYYAARSASGGAWATEVVASDVGAITYEFTEGGLSMDPADLDRMAVSKRDTPDVGDPFRLWLYEYAGGSWAPVAVVSEDDGEAAMYPVWVDGDDGSLPFYWLQGVGIDQGDFDFRIVGFSGGEILGSTLELEVDILGGELTIGAGVTLYPALLHIEVEVLGGRLSTAGPRDLALVGGPAPAPGTSEMTDPLPPAPEEGADVWVLRGRRRAKPAWELLADLADEAGIGGGGPHTHDPADDTHAWMPLTTVVAGEPELVWDGDDSLIPTLVEV
jgi:hypothetical protein